jgi:hypothetical protein
VRGKDNLLLLKLQYRVKRKAFLDGTPFGLRVLAFIELIISHYDVYDSQ